MQQVINNVNGANHPSSSTAGAAKSKGNQDQSLNAIKPISVPALPPEVSEALRSILSDRTFLIHYSEGANE